MLGEAQAGARRVGVRLPRDGQRRAAREHAERRHRVGEDELHADARGAVHVHGGRRPRGGGAGLELMG